MQYITYSKYLFGIHKHVDVIYVHYMYCLQIFTVLYENKVYLLHKNMDFDSQKTLAYICK
jgi:hypothetical protein